MLGDFFILLFLIIMTGNAETRAQNLQKERKADARTQDSR